jgi:hypothetical protein
MYRRNQILQPFSKEKLCRRFESLFVLKQQDFYAYQDFKCRVLEIHSRSHARCATNSTKFLGTDNTILPPCRHKQSSTCCGHAKIGAHNWQFSWLPDEINGFSISPLSTHTIWSRLIHSPFIFVIRSSTDEYHQI